MSDGVNTLPEAKLSIVLSGTSPSNSIHIQTKPITVREGERHFFSTEEISATDGSTNFGDVQFQIEASPQGTVRVILHR